MKSTDTGMAILRVILERESFNEPKPEQIVPPQVDSYFEKEYRRQLEIYRKLAAKYR